MAMITVLFVFFFILMGITGVGFIIPLMLPKWIGLPMFIRFTHWLPLLMLLFLIDVVAIGISIVLGLR